MLKNSRSNTGMLWCKLMHESVTWPVHGHYECRTCGRRYPAFAEAKVANHSGRTAWKPAALSMLVLVLAVFAAPAHAGVAPKSATPAQAQAALERYLSQSGLNRWTDESIEIHAALPKLEKSAWMRVVRSSAPNIYKVTQTSGDRTVEHEVIARYLRAQESASEKLSASVAITLANYKFFYKGFVDDGERQAYVFRISARRNQAGLVRGELWLDPETGLEIREFGRFVKSPSLFIKRVEFNREGAVRNGAIESRLTHVKVAARFVGTAELIVEERPMQAADALQISDSNNQASQR